MSEFDPNEAPKGYVAVADDTGTCSGCCYDDDCGFNAKHCYGGNRRDGVSVVFKKKAGPGDRYIVIARDDHRVYRLLTRQVFETHAGAKHYANGVSPSREPMIVACGANTVILRKERL